MVTRRRHSTLAFGLLTLLIGAAVIVGAVGWPRTAHADLINFFGGERAGTSGGQFLRVPAGARGIAMGGGMSASVQGGSAPFWNPAGMATIEGNGRLFLSHTEFVADIDVDHLAYIRKMGHWQLGVFGGMLTSGDIVRTTELHPEGAGYTFEANQFQAGLSLGRRLTSSFTVAGTLKMLQENLDEFENRGVFVDIGAIYYIGAYGGRLGFALLNFGPDMKLSGKAPDTIGPNAEFQSFSAPTAAVFGFAWDLGTPGKRIWTASIDFNHPTDEQESVLFGTEFGLYDTLFLRGGYRTNVEFGGYSAGFGLHLLSGPSKLRVGYAFDDRGTFGGFHTISVEIGQ